MTAHHAILANCAAGVLPDFIDDGSIGTNQSSTANQTTLVLTTSAVAAAGQLVVLIYAMDNNQTTDGQTSEITSITDSAGGNTWTKAVEFTNGQGTAQAGATVSIWYSKLTNQIASGGTITATFANTATKDKTCVAGWKFTIKSGTLSLEGTPATLANDAADPGSLDVTTTGAQQCLRVRGIAGETNSTTALSSTNLWSAIQGTQTSGGGSAANIAVRGEYLISTGTGSASDPTWVSADHASAYAAWKVT